MRSGYCPWCSREIAEMAYYFGTGEIQWERCREWTCKGSRLDIVSDKQGFVIHPRHIRGRYIYSKPLGDKDA